MSDIDFLPTRPLTTGEYSTRRDRCTSEQLRSLVSSPEYVAFLHEKQQQQEVLQELLHEKQQQQEVLQERRKINRYRKRLFFTSIAVSLSLLVAVALCSLPVNEKGSSFVNQLDHRSWKERFKNFSLSAQAARTSVHGKELIHNMSAEGKLFAATAVAKSVAFAARTTNTGMLAAETFANHSCKAFGTSMSHVKNFMHSLSAQTSTLAELLKQLIATGTQDALPALPHERVVDKQRVTISQPTTRSEVDKPHPPALQIIQENTATEDSKSFLKGAEQAVCLLVFTLWAWRASHRIAKLETVVSKLKTANTDLKQREAALQGELEAVTTELQQMSAHLVGSTAPTDVPLQPSATSAKATPKLKSLVLKLCKGLKIVALCSCLGIVLWQGAMVLDLSSYLPHRSNHRELNFAAWDVVNDQATLASELVHAGAVLDEALEHTTRLEARVEAYLHGLEAASHFFDHGGPLAYSRNAITVLHKHLAICLQAQGTAVYHIRLATYTHDRLQAPKGDDEAVTAHVPSDTTTPALHAEHLATPHAPSQHTTTASTHAPPLDHPSQQPEATLHTTPDASPPTAVHGEPRAYQLLTAAALHDVPPHPHVANDPHMQLSADVVDDVPPSQDLAAGEMLVSPIAMSDADPLRTDNGASTATNGLWDDSLVATEEVLPCDTCHNDDGSAETVTHDDTVVGTAGSSPALHTPAGTDGPYHPVRTTHVDQPSQPGDAMLYHMPPAEEVLAGDDVVCGDACDASDEQLEDTESPAYSDVTASSVPGADKDGVGVDDVWDVMMQEAHEDGDDDDGGQTQHDPSAAAAMDA